MSGPASKKSSPKGGKTGLSAGWILVSGLILLCLAGTGLTWWNYSRQVYSSAQGFVLEPQWPESRLSVELPGDEARHIQPGHAARVSVGKETQVLKGEVVSITPAAGNAKVIVRLLDEAGKTQRTLPTGTQCSVTIDTTVPPPDPTSTPAK